MKENRNGDGGGSSSGSGGLVASNAGSRSRMWRTIRTTPQVASANVLRVLFLVYSNAVVALGAVHSRVIYLAPNYRYAQTHLTTMEVLIDYQTPSTGSHC
ncbi:hypothetical protein V1477_016554 [Vespula maculifrons]|uniref:Uncharacterized protein n=2 Tax=Vespula TaxID=7451 RepID=A0A834N7W0_VESVU|nr:hypothetical protein HZH66_006902 [Vespula vulgaris]